MRMPSLHQQEKGVAFINHNDGLSLDFIGHGNKANIIYIRIQVGNRIHRRKAALILPGQIQRPKKGQSWLYVKSRGLVLSVTKHLSRPKPTQCAFWTYFSTVFQLNLAVDILYQKIFKINECSDSRIIRELPVPCSQITQVMLCKSYQCQRTCLCVLLCAASSKWTL